MRIFFPKLVGFGIFLACLLGMSHAGQGFGDPMGATRKIPSSAVMLTAISDVKKELKLSGDQSKKVDAIRKAFEKEMGAVTKEMQGAGGMAAGMEALKSIGSAIDKADADVRREFNPGQVARLRALQYQALGPKALYEKDLQASLELTQDQITRIDAQKAGEMARLTQVFGGGGHPAGPKEMQKRLKEMRAESEKQLIGVLTTEQAAKYRDALGAPVKALKALAESSY